MARVKSIQMHISEPYDVRFSYDVNVSKDGEFSTTLPKHIVDLFDSAGIRMSSNRLGNKGFFLSATMDDLQKQVSAEVVKLTSRKLVSERIVLKYNIDTACSYCIDEEGNIVPNGTYRKDATAGRYWRNGSIDRHACERGPFSLSVAVEPYTRRDYIFEATGEEKVQYEHISSNSVSIRERPQLHWIASLCAMAPESGRFNTGGYKHEIDYTESTALFFVNTIKGLCALNEAIKDKVSPASIKEMLSAGQTNLLESKGGSQ